jgi:hypothetical protein
VLGGGAADTDRRSFGATRSHASRSQQHTSEVEPPEGEVPSTVASLSGACRAGGQGLREKGVRRITQEAETVTGRVRRVASPLVDVISLRATAFTAY